MPDWKAIVHERLAGLSLNGAQEADVVEELAQDLEERYAELLERGVPKDEAIRLAQEILDQAEVLGKELRIRDRLRPEPLRPFSGFGQDVRLAWRNLAARPAFSGLVIGMLALGIAGNAAIFSIFNGMFLHPLPFRESRQLVDLDETAPKWSLKYVGVSEPDLFAWRKGNTTFQSMAFFGHPDFNLSGFGAAQRIHGAAVTADMLNLLGLQPLLGRNFSREEDRPHAAKVVLLSYNLWRRLFGSSPQVVGRMMKLSGEAHTVVGVLPKGAIFPDRADLWVPLGPAPNSDNGWYLNGIGRLKRGVSITQAHADLTRVHTTAHLPANKITSPIITPLRDRYLGDFRIVSRVLLCAVGIVLLIACVNVAALMMVRAFTRAREIAIRAAVGASHRRIIRQLLTENLVLASLGGAGGIVLGYFLLRGLLALMPVDEMPGWLTFPMDARFAAFCIFITGTAALLSGLVPALQASRVDTGSCLQETGTRTSISQRSRRTLNGLVVCEIGLALVLLISAGLLLRAFQKVLHVDPGFRPENVITFGVELPDATYGKPEQRLIFFRKLLEQLRTLPGLRAAGAASAPPLGGHWGQFFTAEGAPPLGLG